MNHEMDAMVYTVVVNDEDQYSIWPAQRQLPDGWRREGEPGARQDCLDDIRKRWTDMRPRSLRERMSREGSGS